MTAPFSFAQRLDVPSHVSTSDLHGELVLLNFETETYFGLDAVGARMWTVLEQAPTLEDGLQTLLGEYDVEEARLRADVQALIDQLVDGGLVGLRDA